MISNYLVHYQTGEPIPAELLAKIKNAATFNQGFETTEYLASAIMDMKYHTVDPTDLDPDAAYRVEHADRELGLPHRQRHGLAERAEDVIDVDRLAVGPRPGNAMDDRLEEGCRIIKGEFLGVLAKPDEGRPAIARIGIVSPVSPLKFGARRTPVINRVNSLEDRAY